MKVKRTSNALFPEVKKYIVKGLDFSLVCDELDGGHSIVIYGEHEPYDFTYLTEEEYEVIERVFGLAGKQG